MHCLDASALVDYLEGDEAVDRFVTDHEREPLFSPSVALSETFVGAVRTRGEDGLERARAELDWVEPVDLTVGDVADAARVDRELHDAGEPIGAPDALIAGVVRDAGGTVVTADPHFERVDGLDVLRYDEEYRGRGAAPATRSESRPLPTMTPVTRRAPRPSSIRRSARAYLDPGDPFEVASVPRHDRLAFPERRRREPGPRRRERRLRGRRAEGERGVHGVLPAHAGADGELVVADYPTEFVEGESRPVVVDLDNHEHETATYEVVVLLQDVEFVGNDSTRVLAERELDRFGTTVADNETWTREYEVRPTMTGERLRLAFLLYRGEAAPEPAVENAYRETHLWVNVTASDDRRARR